MKASSWLVLMVVAIVAAGLLLARGQVGQKVEAAPEVDALRQQVGQLQVRFKMLEDRLTKLESAKQHTVPHVEVVPNPPSLPPSIFIPSPLGVPNRSGQQPKIWGQGEINGWPFYLIPCAGR